MKAIRNLAALLLVSIILVIAAVVALTLEDKPKLQARADLRPEQIARGKLVLQRNDPRALRSGSIARAVFAQEEMDLAINYLANQYAGGVAGVVIEKGRAMIEGSLQLPDNPLGRYLNLKLEFRQSDSLPEIDHMMLGKLWIPGILAERLVGYGVVTMQPTVDWQAFGNIVRHVYFQPRQVIVTYRWQADLPAKLRGSLLSVADQNRIEVYQRRLAELSQQNAGSLNLPALTRPMFQLAKQRSIDGDAVAENRAAILVLTFYVNRMSLYKIVNQSNSWPRPLWRTVTLSGREDFTKHYLVSALLAAYSGTPLADAVGVFKEIEDSRGGSGFSFNDIAADRAGTRMGELAVDKNSGAKKIQTLLAAAQESDIMPATADLPEFMPEAEFERRFGGIDGWAYRQMMAEIEKRVEALPVSRD